MSLPDDWAASAVRNLYAVAAEARKGPAAASGAGKTSATASRTVASASIDPDAGRPVLPERLAGTIFGVVPDTLWARAGAQAGKPVTRAVLAAVWQLLGSNGLDSEAWYAAAAIDPPDPKRPTKPTAVPPNILAGAGRRMVEAFA